MAEKDIILKLKLDTDDSVANVEKVEKAFKDLGKVEKEVGKLEETTKNAKQQLAELEDQLADIGDKGSEDFKRIAKQAGALKRQVDDSTKAIESYAAKGKNLTAVVQGFSSIGHAAELAIGAQALLGTENENVARSIEKMVAIQSVLNGVEELHLLLTEESVLSIKAKEVATKAMAASQSAYTAIVGTSTGALKVFKIALAATGIGAILLLLGLLIANFKDVSNWVENLGNRFTWLKPIIDDVKKSFEDFEVGLKSIGLIEDEDINRKKEMIEKSEELRKEIGDRYDFEINKAKAAGQNTYDLEQEKRNAIIETLKTQAQAILELAILNGGASEEQIEQIKKIKELAQSTFREIVVARITEEKRGSDEIEKINKEAADKAKTIKEKQLEEDKKLADEKLAQIQAEQDLSDELFRKNQERTLSETDFKIQELIRGYDAAYLLAKDNAELTAELDAEIKAGIDEIKAEQTEKDLEAERDKNEKKKALDDERIAAMKAVAETEQKIREASLDNISAGIGLIASLDEKNKGLQAAALVGANAAGIAKTIITTQAANAAATAEGVALAIPTAGASVATAAALVTANNISAGISIGTSIAATAKGLAALKKSGNTGGGIGVSAPKIPSTSSSGGQQGQQGVDAEGTLTADLLNPQGGGNVTVLASDIKRVTGLNEQSISTSEL